MFKTITLLLMIAALSGCAGIQQAQMNAKGVEVEREAARECTPQMFLGEKEAAAFSDASEESHKKCNPNGKVLTKENADEIYQCTTPMWEEFKSASSSPKKWSTVLKERKKLFSDFESGEIYRAKLEADINKSLMGYLKSVHKGSYYNATVCRMDLVKEKMLPIYFDKPLMLGYIADAEEFADDADKRHLKLEEFNLGEKKLHEEFARDEQDALADARQQQADQAAITQQNIDALQQIVQSLSQMRR